MPSEKAKENKALVATCVACNKSFSPEAMVAFAKTAVVGNFHCASTVRKGDGARPVLKDCSPSARQ
jgi:hypothetical protein